MIIMLAIHSVSFVNRFIPTTKMKKMIRNGWAVTSAKDGYLLFNVESYLMRKKVSP